MINKLSIKITSLLLKYNCIKEDDFELYNYGLFVIISELYFLTIVTVIGLFLKTLLPSLLFYVIYQILHRFAGGFHLKTELSCQIVTILTFLLALLFIRYYYCFSSNLIICLLVIGAILLVALSPADTPNKILSKQEKQKFKLLTAITLVVLIAVYFAILKLFGANYYTSTIFISIFLEAILVALGRLLNHRI